MVLPVLYEMDVESKKGELSGDVFFTKSPDLASWSAPARLNDDTGENDNVAPKLCDVGEEVLAVWFDNRESLENRGQYNVYAAVVTEGKTPNFRVSSSRLDTGLLPLPLRGPKAIFR